MAQHDSADGKQPDLAFEDWALDKFQAFLTADAHRELLKDNADDLIDLAQAKDTGSLKSFARDLLGIAVEFHQGKFAKDLIKKYGQGKGGKQKRRPSLSAEDQSAIAQMFARRSEGVAFDGSWQQMKGFLKSLGVDLLVTVDDSSQECEVTPINVERFGKNLLLERKRSLDDVWRVLSQEGPVAGGRYALCLLIGTAGTGKSSFLFRLGHEVLKQGTLPILVSFNHSWADNPTEDALYVLAKEQQEREDLSGMVLITHIIHSLAFGDEAGDLSGFYAALWGRFAYDKRSLAKFGEAVVSLAEKKGFKGVFVGVDEVALSIPKRQEGQSYPVVSSLGTMLKASRKKIFAAVAGAEYTAIDGKEWDIKVSDKGRPMLYHNVKKSKSFQIFHALHPLSPSARTRLLSKALFEWMLKCPERDDLHRALIRCVVDCNGLPRLVEHLHQLLLGELPRDSFGDLRAYTDGDKLYTAMRQSLMLRQGMAGDVEDSMLAELVATGRLRMGKRDDALRLLAGMANSSLIAQPTSHAAAAGEEKDRKELVMHVVLPSFVLADASSQGKPLVGLAQKLLSHRSSEKGHLREDFCTAFVQLLRGSLRAVNGGVSSLQALFRGGACSFADDLWRDAKVDLSSRAEVLPFEHNFAKMCQLWADGEQAYPEGLGKKPQLLQFLSNNPFWDKLHIELTDKGNVCFLRQDKTKDTEAKKPGTLSAPLLKKANVAALNEMFDEGKHEKHCHAFWQKADIRYFVFVVESSQKLPKKYMGKLTQLANEIATRNGHRAHNVIVLAGKPALEEYYTPSFYGHSLFVGVQESRRAVLGRKEKAILQRTASEGFRQNVLKQCPPAGSSKCSGCDLLIADDAVLCSGPGCGKNYHLRCSEPFDFLLGGEDDEDEDCHDEQLEERLVYDPDKFACVSCALKLYNEVENGAPAEGMLVDDDEDERKRRMAEEAKTEARPAAKKRRLSQGVPQAAGKAHRD